jgi:hypothetical protein
VGGAGPQVSGLMCPPTLVPPHPEAAQNGCRSLELLEMQPGPQPVGSASTVPWRLCPCSRGCPWPAWGHCLGPSVNICFVISVLCCQAASVSLSEKETDGPWIVPPWWGQRIKAQCQTGSGPVSISEPPSPLSCKGPGTLCGGAGGPSHRKGGVTRPQSYARLHWRPGPWLQGRSSSSSIFPGLFFSQRSPIKSFQICIYSVLEAGSHYVAQAGLELSILLPQPPQCWDYRCGHHARPFTCP